MIMMINVFLGEWGRAADSRDSAKPPQAADALSRSYLRNKEIVIFVVIIIIFTIFIGISIITSMCTPSSLPSLSSLWAGRSSMEQRDRHFCRHFHNFHCPHHLQHHSHHHFQCLRHRHRHHCYPSIRWRCEQVAIEQRDRRSYDQFHHNFSHYHIHFHCSHHHHHHHSSNCKMLWVSLV